MQLQEFLDANRLDAGKAVIGSPVKMAIEENVELSAIDALQLDSFEVQVDEFDEPCRVDAVKAGYVVAYVHVVIVKEVKSSIEQLRQGFIDNAVDRIINGGDPSIAMDSIRELTKIIDGLEKTR